MHQLDNNYNNNGLKTNTNDMIFPSSSSDTESKEKKRSLSDTEPKETEATKLYDHHQQKIYDAKGELITALVQQKITGHKNIPNLFAKHDPQLYTIYINQILPKIEEINQIQRDIFHRQAKVNNLIEEENIIYQRQKNTEANLKPSETNKVLYSLNILGEGILRSGLAINGIIALLTIVGITNLQELGKGWGWAATAAVFSGISIVYLSSFAIYDWVISENQNTPDDEKFLTIPGINMKIRKLTVNCSILFSLEVLLGYAVIPHILEIQRQFLNNNRGLDIPELTAFDELKLLSGFAIFAFINIWGSVAKGRRFMFTNETRKQLNELKVAHSNLQIIITNHQAEIAKMESEIEKLDSEIKPYTDTINFGDRYQDVTDSLTARQHQQNPSLPILDISE